MAEQDDNDLGAHHETDHPPHRDDVRRHARTDHRTRAWSAEASDDAETPNPAQTTQQSPMPQSMETMTEAMDSAVQPVSTGNPFADARTAAQHMPMTAANLAAGFTIALDIPGETDSDAADLRARLTSMLQEHVYLAGIAVATAYTTGPDSPEFDAAATLDENTAALADAVGSLAGQEKGDAFLELWRKHIGFFVDYAVAIAGDDEDGAQQALMDLDGYRSDAGAFFEEISDGALPAEDGAEGLATHVQTLAGAIDSLNEALVQTN